MHDRIAHAEYIDPDGWTERIEDARVRDIRGPFEEEVVLNEVTALTLKDFREGLILPAQWIETETPNV